MTTQSLNRRKASPVIWCIRAALRAAFAVVLTVTLVLFFAILWLSQSGRYEA